MSKKPPVPEPPSSWPSFLTLLQTDWCEASNEFADFAYRLLKARPPRLLAEQSSMEQDEWIQETIIHFIEDECRVLKRYTDTGSAFNKWFMAVAHNKILDLYRHRKTDLDRITDRSDEDQTSETVDSAQDHTSHQEFRLRRRELSEAIAKCFPKMREKCRILIRAYAKEREYSDMAILVGLSPDQNKNVSNDLHFCLRTLKSLLVEAGYSMNDFLN